MKEYRASRYPTNIELLCYATKTDYKKLRQVLTLRPTRTLSGVTPVAIMAKPVPCPHGKCLFCPGGIDSAFGNVPQSYTGHEPSTMRSIRAGYDPYLNIFNRLEQFVIQGHDISKVEIIIQSGTFCAFDTRYQNQLIKSIFMALNDFSKYFFVKGELNFEKVKTFYELPADLNDEERGKRVQKRIKELKKKNIRSRAGKVLSIDDEHDYNDKKSVVKCVGLTVETRPDWARKKHGEKLLKLGVTRIELGVQSVYDDVLKFVERGHTTKDSINSIRELKNLGFKLNFHYMPGLCSYKKDLEGMKRLFDSTDYRPDMLKIYPCMVMKGTKLYDLFRQGKFKPITTKKAVELISEFTKYIPKYCRVMRVQRDIPTNEVVAGVDKTNLRQLIDCAVKDKKIKSQEIRSKESSRVENSGDLRIEVMEYDASEAIEYFISYEDDSSIYGFLRLRIIEDDNLAFVRELHVYGKSLKVGSKGSKNSDGKDDSTQHKGIGKKLMDMAEVISKSCEVSKIKVISGVGVRGYYRKLGYKLQGTYMIKIL